MADFIIKNPTEFDPNLRKLETTDRNHADVFNKEFEQLINNDAFLKAVTELAIEHMRSDAVHVTEQDKQTWSGKAGTAVATQSKNGLESAADKKKLDGIATSAEVNQFAFSRIDVGGVKVTSNGKTAAFTLEAGSNITITADNASKKIIITANKDGGNADTLDGYHAAHFAVADHGHDGRYYTKTESNNLLNGKANSSHSHNGIYYTKNEINNRFDGQHVVMGDGANAVGHVIWTGDGNSHPAYSIAIGNNANANGNDSEAIAIGGSAEALDNNAIALGGWARARAGGIALGAVSEAIGEKSIVVGKGTEAYGSNSIALGNFAEVNGMNSIAIGDHARTSNANSIQLGNQDKLSSITARVGITVTSDERDKADITELGNGAVEFINKIKAIRYVWNGRQMYIDEENLSDKDRENRRKYGLCTYDKEAHAKGIKKGSRIRVGVSAQATQAALKEVYGDTSYANLVNNNFFDMQDVPEGIENQLTMNYEGFIPFLIKAIQELKQTYDLEIKKLKKEISFISKSEKITLQN